MGLAVNGNGDLYITDGGLRRVDTRGIISTIAEGAGGYGGPVTEALKGPEGIAIDANGVIYVADTNNHRIRKINADGSHATIAGDGNWGLRGDGASALQARLYFPRSVAVDRDGSLFIADTLNHRVRKVSVSGVITTIAGAGAGGSSADGDPAISTPLNPHGIAVDDAGNLFVADPGKRRILRITPDGVIRTVAGGGP
jgi:sugar lactone lactonase YvrE